MISANPDDRPSLEEILNKIDENRKRERLWASFARKAIQKLDKWCGRANGYKKLSRSFKQ